MEGDDGGDDDDDGDGDNACDTPLTFTSASTSLASRYNTLLCSPRQQKDESRSETSSTPRSWQISPSFPRELRDSRKRRDASLRSASPLSQVSQRKQAEREICARRRLP